MTATTATKTREGDPVSTIEVPGKTRMAGDTKVVQVETVYEYADGSILRNGRGGTMIKLTKAQRAGIADLPRQPYAPPETEPEAAPEPNASAKAAEPEATPSPEPEATPEAAPAKGKQPYTLTVPLSEAQGVPRHFWGSLGADGGAAVAKSYGVEVSVDNKAEALILTGPRKAELEKARRAIIKTWVDGLAASKVWRTNPEYKAASTQDRWRMLTAYLRAYGSVVVLNP